MLYALILLALLIIPVVLLARSLVEGVQTLTAHMENGTLAIPPPADNVAGWLIIGGSSVQPVEVGVGEPLRCGIAQIKSALPQLLSASAEFGLAVLQFLHAILVAGALLVNAPAANLAARSMFVRIFEDRGPEYYQLVSSTIRGVTSGIPGVALIQNSMRGTRFSCRRIAGRRLVGGALPHCRRTADGRAGIDSSSHLQVRDRQHHEGGHLSNLI